MNDYFSKVELEMLYYTVLKEYDKRTKEAISTQLSLDGNDKALKDRQNLDDKALAVLCHLHTKVKKLKSKDSVSVSTEVTNQKLDDLEISVLLDSNHPGGEGENGRYQESYFVKDADHLTRMIKFQASKGKQVRGTIRITDLTPPIKKEVA